MRCLRLIKNQIDFFLNQKIAFSRTGYFETPEDKSGLFCAEIEEQADALLKKYGILEFKGKSAVVNYLENLWLLDILDRYAKADFKEKLNVLEVGCKNWSCAKAQYHFFKKHAEKLLFTGIELDANRIYYNLFSRKEAAKFYSKGLEGSQYIAGDFLEHKGEYDCIIWVLPFLFEEPLLAWGLPKQYFSPQKMLEHALSLISQGGKIFIVNQGGGEYEEQKRLYRRCKIDFEDIGKIESPFLNYKIERYLTIAHA